MRRRALAAAHQAANAAGVAAADRADYVGSAMAIDAEHFKGLAGFRRGLRRFLVVSERISREAGVTPQQYQVLLAIKAADASQFAMKDLAEELLLAPHATVQLVDRLERAGLAERRPSEGDRRFVFLALTPKGETLINQLGERHLEEMLRQEPQLRSSLNRLRRLSP
jgi:DNA-binding MarR family transcriptional regulator